VILQLIEKAGDFVSDDIWYRVVQFVTNNEDLQVTPYGDFLIVEFGQKPLTSVALQIYPRESGIILVWFFLD
jgi:hypothetical protein